MADVGQGPAVRVLGPLEVETAGRLVEIGGSRLRAVLALLVTGAGRVVSVPALVDGLWGAHPPAGAERSVRAYVSLLRKALAPDGTGAGPAGADTDGLIVTRAPGYLLRLEPDAVDTIRFERLAAAGRRTAEAGQHASAAEQLAGALGLWRGEAYGEFADSAVLQAESARLGRLRLSATESRIEADLGSGLGGELIAELDGLTGRYPGHERLWGQLMRALYRAGRQTDALAVYQRARGMLIDQAGVEPSPPLTAIHRQILAQDPQLLTGPGSTISPADTVHAVDPAGPAPAPAPDGAPVTRPLQLPPAVRAFTGRVPELARLDALLPGAEGSASDPAVAVITAVSGTAGVGKSALALHWAHRVADRFPDGLLYVNLRGFDPGGRAMHPAEAVRGFLDALGTPAQRVPAGLDPQVALYRSKLAGRSVLIVLDNARDAEQVRPLLPGTATAMVVVTSRDQLTGLAAADGAHPIVLDLLSTAEARELLAQRLGPDRVNAEPQAVLDIIRACARLPLALSIAAARAAQTGFRLADLAAELADSSGRLGVLDAGDPSTQVRAVFTWSYRTLAPPAARLFRLLALHPGSDVSVRAAASLAGHPPAEVRPLLAELGRANLITEHLPGRYSFHDLLRVYAEHLLHANETEAEPRAAVGRLLDHYTHTTNTIDRLLDPTRGKIYIPLAPPAAGASVEHPAGPQQAITWLAAEHANLLQVLRQAADTGHDVQLWQLAWALDTFLGRHGHWQDLAAAWRAAIEAAERLGHLSAQAYAHRLTARSYTRLGRHADAHHEHGLALALYARAGYRAGEADAHLDLADSYGRQGRPDLSVNHAQQALTLYRPSGRRGLAYALNALGWFHAQLGDHARGLRHCQQALTLHQQGGDRVGEASTWDSLGFIHHHLDHYDRAVDSYQHALDLFRDLGDPTEEANTLTNLGEAHQDAGHHTAARGCWQQALHSFTELGYPKADAIRRKLHGIDQVTPAGSVSQVRTTSPPFAQGSRDGEPVGREARDRGQPGSLPSRMSG